MNRKVTLHLHILVRMLPRQVWTDPQSIYWTRTENDGQAQMDADGRAIEVPSSVILAIHDNEFV